MSLRVARPFSPQRVRGDLGALVEARLEVAQVDRLGVRPERLERHRLLHVRAAQLAHPHVDRVLAALEAGALLRAGARAAPFWPRPAVLPVPEPSPRPTRLRGLREPWAGFSECSPIARRRPRRHRPPPGGGRAWSMPRICGVSSCSTVWPIRRRPSERSVSRCCWLAPFLDRTWVIAQRLRPAPRTAVGLRRSAAPSAAPLGASRGLLLAAQAEHLVDASGRAARRPRRACAAPAARRPWP